MCKQFNSSQLARRGPGEQRSDFGETERGPGGLDAEADGTELGGARRPRDDAREEAGGVRGRGGPRGDGVGRRAPRGDAVRYGSSMELAVIWEIAR